MPSSRTVVTTQKASKYLQQLCKHFAHKVAVRYDLETAEVAFPFGACRMYAHDSFLSIECDANSEDELRRAQNVIDDHLGRFAWREAPKIIWKPVSI